MLDVLQTILETLELQLSFLGLLSVRGFLSPTELMKLGDSAPGYLFIPLTSFQNYYLVVVITIEGFRYALTRTQKGMGDGDSKDVIADLGWLDPERLGLGPVPNEYELYL